MRRAWIAALILAVACRAPVPAVATVDRVCVAARDSLQLVLDSTRSRLREQVVLIRLTEQQAKRYAKIVGRDPSQSRFIVGWMNRAFQGVVPDSVQ